MSGLYKGLFVLATLAGAVALVGSADARVKRHRAPHATAERAPNFPLYVSRGVDRNPGGDNLYFSDTKRPSYIVGPAWFQRWE